MRIVSPSTFIQRSRCPLYTNRAASPAGSGLHYNSTRSTLPHQLTSASTLPWTDYHQKSFRSPFHTLRLLNTNQKSFFHKNYSTASAQATKQPSELASPVDKVEQLLTKGTDYVSKEDYRTAQPLLEGALDLLKKFGLPEEDKTATLIYLNLAYVYHRLENYSPAEGMYSRAIKIMDSSKFFNTSEEATALINHAEFLACQKNFEAGIEQVKRAIGILRNYPRGSNTTFLAAALSNYAGYLCAMKRFEEAKEPCSEALKIFTKQLGKQNDFTKSTFSHMYQIFKELNMEQAISDLEADWNAVDETNVKGLNDQELADITEAFLHSVQKAESKAMPTGPVKGPKIYKKQLNEFFGVWEEKGFDLKDPAITPVLKQELDALKLGDEVRKKLKTGLKKKREHVIKKRKESVVSEMEFYQNKEKQKLAYQEWKIFNKPDYIKEINGADDMLNESNIRGVNPTGFEDFLNIDKLADDFEAQEKEMDRQRKVAMAQALAQRRNKDKVGGGLPEEDGK